MAVSRHIIIHIGKKHIDLKKEEKKRKRKGKKKGKNKEHKTLALALIVTGWVREQIHSNCDFLAPSL